MMHARVLKGRVEAPRSLAATLTLVVGGAAALAYTGLFLSAGPDHTLLGLACLSSVVICAVPFVIRREDDVFQPLGYILALTIIAMPLRHVYLMLTPPGDEALLRLTNHEPISFFIPAALMINIALLGLISGDLCTTYRFRIERISLLTTVSWRTHCFWPLMVVLIALSIVAFVTLIRLSGFELHENVAFLSKKRRFPDDVASGYLTWATELAKYALFVTVAYLMSRRRRLTGSGALALLVMVAVAVAPPFFSSSRTGVMIIVLAAMVTYVYMGGKISLPRAALLIVPSLAVVSMITMFRAGGSTWTGWGDVFDPIHLLTVVAGAWNYGGFVATAHVMNALGLEEYTLGSTLPFWMYAWIPRSIWPEKPIEVGYMLLGILDFRGDLETRRGGGAAAGLPAELYLSFGPFLVPFGMFVFGAFTRLIYNSLRPLAYGSPVAAVFCATVSIALAHSYAYGLSRGMLMLGKDAIALGLIFLVLLRSSRPTCASPPMRS